MSVGVASVEASNSVLLSGRLAAAAEERVLANGAVLCTCRLIVPRAAPTAPTTVAPLRRGPSTDLVDVVSWSPRLRRTMMGWHPGDEVRVEGSLRRRFFRTGQRTVSRTEVEVSAARRVRRGASG